MRRLTLIDWAAPASDTFPTDAGASRGRGDEVTGHATPLSSSLFLLLHLKSQVRKRLDSLNTIKSVLREENVPWFLPSLHRDGWRSSEGPFLRASTAIVCVWVSGLVDGGETGLTAEMPHAFSASCCFTVTSKTEEKRKLTVVWFTASCHILL